MWNWGDDLWAPPTLPPPNGGAQQGSWFPPASAAPDLVFEAPTRVDGAQPRTEVPTRVGGARPFSRHTT